MSQKVNDLLIQIHITDGCQTCFYHMGTRSHVCLCLRLGDITLRNTQYWLFFGKSLNLDVWTDKFKYTILVCARLLYSSQYSHAYFWARCQVALLNRQYSLITVFRFFLSDHNILITLTSFLIEHWNKAVFFSRGFFWHFLPFRWFSSFSRFLLFSCLKMRKSEPRRLFSVCCWVEVEKETEAMLIGRPMGARGRAHDG